MTKLKNTQVSEIGINKQSTSMQIIEGNILDITEGIICHQVNCQGVFNAGLAKQIREKYPQGYASYMEWHNPTSFNNPKGWKLGDLQIVQINSKLAIAQLAGQLKYGRVMTTVKSRYTSYQAIRTGLTKLQLHYASSLEYFPGEKVYIPYGMGCGLGGGDWSVVSEIINEIIPYAIIVKLPKQN